MLLLLKAVDWVLMAFWDKAQDHGPQSTFYSQPPLQRSEDAGVAPRSKATLQELLWGNNGGPSEDPNLHSDPQTDHLQQNHAQTQKKKILSTTQGFHLWMI